MIKQITEDSKENAVITENPEKKQSKVRKYALPSEELIIETGIGVLSTSGTIDSQEKMRKLVLRKIRFQNDKYKLSGKRLRKALIKSGNVKIQIITREVPGKRPYFTCPVCDTKLVKIRNQTLNGTEVILGYRCPLCGYWTHRKRRMPFRYIFSIGRNL
jgi:transposase-like protein